MLSQEQQKRVVESLTETMALVEKYTHQKTFDQYQEAKRQHRLAQYTAHGNKLLAMLKGA